MSAAYALEHRLTQCCPNVVFYAPLSVDTQFVFILNRLLATLSTLAGDGLVEVLHIDICAVTRIPTVQLMLPPQVSNAMVAPLFDETQILLQRAAGLGSTLASTREASQ